MPQKKEFLIRNSPLTDKLESSKDARTVYNVVMVTYINFAIIVILNDYWNDGQSRYGFRLIVNSFKRFDLAIVIWCCLNLLASAAYYCFRFWASVRTGLPPTICRFWDQIWILILLFYLYASLYGIHKAIPFFGFAEASAATLVLEQVRLLMKQYSFIRSNAPRVTGFKTHSDKALNLPNFQKFMYFLFAPTLLYRDEYPRTPCIRWKFVLYNFMELLLVIYMGSLTYEIFLVPVFRDICIKKFTVNDILISFFNSGVSGLLILFGIIYVHLHLIQNAVGELLRFGDRMFYKEWWNSEYCSDYFRSENVLVKDWLYTYIYKDMYEIILPKNKIVAKAAVFLISAIMHEWMASTIFGFFFPITFALFVGAALYLTILDSRIGNLMFLCFWNFGTTVIVNLYTLEIFARKNCATERRLEGLDFIKPTFITCGCIE